MAKKSFKKGVKSVIDSIDNDKKDNTPEKKITNEPKTKTSATRQKPKPVQQKEKKQEFSLGNRFIVQEANTAMIKLKEALSNNNEVTILSDEIIELDVSFMQMIVAFDKAANAKELKVNWKLIFSDDIIKVMQHSGMCDVLKPFLDESMAEIVANG
jgi:hypothetical protein